MSIKGRYKAGIDELNVLIKTAFGYVSSIDEIKTPKNADFDEIKTPSNNGIDELRSRTNNFSNMDEINVQSSTTNKRKSTSPTPSSEISEKKKKEVEDDFLEYLIFAYDEGIKAVNEMLTSDVTTNFDNMYLTIEKKVNGKTYDERVREYLDKGDMNALLKVADTEYHRVFNEAMAIAAKEGGARSKTWETMEDDKVRDAHWSLQGVTVGIDDKFYTDGDSASYPGDFESADLNINCRCYVEYKK